MAAADYHLTKWGKVLASVLGVLLLGCCTFAVMRAGDEDHNSDARRGLSAELACQDIIERRLKAPDTAEYSDLEHTGFGSTWTVTGRVSAENLFGVPIRMDFTCKVELDDDGDYWNLISLTGLNG